MGNAFSSEKLDAVKDKVEKVIDKVKNHDFTTTELAVGGVAAVAGLLYLSSDAISLKLRPHFSLEIIPGVRLPYWVHVSKTAANFFDFNLQTTIGVAKALSACKIDKALVGRKKDSTEDLFRSLQTKATNVMIKEKKNDAAPVDGYFYFGTDAWVRNLELFYKHNPFFAMCLTAGEESGERFLELKAYDEDDFAKDLGTKYYRFLRAMPAGSGRQINVRFNKDMQVTRIAVYDESAGKSVVQPKDKWNYYATGALYNGLFIGSGFHATIHILHYVLCSAIDYCTSHDTSMKTWAEPYLPNISMKYLQVSLLLIRPASIGNLLQKAGLKFSPEEDYLLTSPELLGAGFSQESKKYFTTWGQCDTAEDFMNKSMFVDLIASGGKDLIEEFGLVPQFRKIVDYVGPYAKDLTAAMKKDGEAAFNKTEKELTRFLQSSGDAGMTISTISSFVEVMSVTGIMHGSTLSMTRLIATPEIVRWNNINSDVWSARDKHVVDLLFVTVSGTENGRHVFMHDAPNKKGKEWEISKIGKSVSQVMKKYDEAVDQEAEDYKKALMADVKNFREFGWILTDWCPDGFDGKQLTITTYI